MIKSAVTIICIVSTLWGLYELGIRFDSALNSNGPEYSNVLRRIDILDCKIEHRQTGVVDEPQTQLSGTQIDNLFKKIALPSCTLKQLYQLQDTAIEAFKLNYFKGESGVVVTAIDQFKNKEADKCETSINLVKIICPNSFKNANYKDLD